MKKYYKITLSHSDLMPLRKKKKIIDAMYGDIDKNKMGFIEKFARAIGYSKLILKIQSDRVVIPEKIKSPDTYLMPNYLLYDTLRSPIDSFNILEFIIPDRKYTHTFSEFDYTTKDISEKWTHFLQKIYPSYQVTLENIQTEENLDLSLKEFAFQYFYRNIGDGQPYTIEFGSESKLTEAEMAYMIPKLQQLTRDKITIAQFPCETCQKQGKPYHIEIVYLSRYGKNYEEQAYRQYGNAIHHVQ